MSTGKRVAALLLGIAMVGGGATYLSTRGIDQIDSHEGLRLVAYPDPATGGAPWTICRGHTLNVYKGMRATPEQCDKWFAEDLWRAEQCVQRAVRVPLKQGAYDAYTSFVFNVGCARFATSTMARLANQKQYTKSCDEFPKWKYANKMVLEGIVKRRHKEQATCKEDGPYVYLP